MFVMTSTVTESTCCVTRSMKLTATSEFRNVVVITVGEDTVRPVFRSMTTASVMMNPVFEEMFKTNGLVTGPPKNARSRNLESESVLLRSMVESMCGR